jgi:hypothetical protein
VTRSVTPRPHAAGDRLAELEHENRELRTRLRLGAELRAAGHVLGVHPTAAEDGVELALIAGFRLEGAELVARNGKGERLLGTDGKVLSPASWLASALAERPHWLRPGRK